MSFSDYLENRQSAMQAVTDSLKKDITTDVRQGDDNIWKPKMGSDNTGYAVVRFLPGKDVTKAPFVKMYSHGFQGPTGKWYIENSLTTLAQKDPVSEYNTKLWNNGTEDGKEQARKQKRRTQYYANVLVMKDPANPENEGKVKLYAFGQKIFDKIMAALQPEFADDEAINPFDLIEGANFRIKIKMVGGYWNYDSSDFEKPSPLSEDESKLEAVYNAQHDVHALVEPSNFKSYEELQTKLFDVLELSETVSHTPVAAPVEEKSSEFASAFESTDSSSSVSSDDDEDLESYFKNLANN